VIDIPFVQCNTANYKKGRTSDIKYIVLHYTANNGDTAKNNGDFFKNNKPKVSAHIFIDETGYCQSVDFGDTAQHCGGNLQGKANDKYGIKNWHGKCTNANSIGIEHCSRKDANGNYYFKQETIDNSIKLVKELMQQYNIPIENVIRHYDVTYKLCPYPLLTLESWGNYKARLWEDDEMLSYEQFEAYMDRYRKELGQKEATLGEYKKAVETGITDGSRPLDFATRQEVAVMINRAR
jgi:N-acetylmuramoyl-L-alanine amidase